MLSSRGRNDAGQQQQQRNRGDDRPLRRNNNENDDKHGDEKTAQREPQEPRMPKYKEPTSAVSPNLSFAPIMYVLTFWLCRAQTHTHTQKLATTNAFAGLDDDEGSD